LSTEQVSKTHLRKEIEESRYFVEIINMELESLSRILDKIYNNRRYMDDDLIRFSEFRNEMLMYRTYEENRIKSLNQLLENNETKHS